MVATRWPISTKQGLPGQILRRFIYSVWYRWCRGSHLIIHFRHRTPPEAAFRFHYLVSVSSNVPGMGQTRAICYWPSFLASAISSVPSSFVSSICEWVSGTVPGTAFCWLASVWKLLSLLSRLPWLLLGSALLDGPLLTRKTLLQCSNGVWTAANSVVFLFSIWLANLFFFEVVAYVFTFYILSFAVDLFPSIRTRRHIPQGEKDAHDVEETVPPAAIYQEPLSNYQEPYSTYDMETPTSTNGLNSLTGSYAPNFYRGQHIS